MKQHITYIIDDDPTFSHTAKRLIEVSKIDTTIYIFANGKEALDYIRQHVVSPASVPDQVFLDITMPVMDGWKFLEALEELRNPYAELIRVTMISSSTNPADQEKAATYARVERYWEKPLTLKQLREVYQQTA